MREELFDALRVGIAPIHLIRQRTAEYRAESRLDMPRLIVSRAIDTLGDEPQAEAAAGGHKGLAISSGEASGRQNPYVAPRRGRFGPWLRPGLPEHRSLVDSAVCRRRGPGLERGGMLSHGAVVARELGLPAVVLPHATRLLRDGEEIRVNGRRGWVGKLSEASVAESSAGAAGPDDTSVPRELVPPPPGPKDRAAAKVRNALAVVWTAFLLSVFLFPARWVYQPTMAVLDFVLWPLVRTVGKPGTVAAVASAWRRLAGRCDACK